MHLACFRSIRPYLFSFHLNPQKIKFNFDFLISERRYGVYLWGFIASSLIAVLTLLIVILWLTNQLKYHFLIVFLIVLFIILAVSSMVFVELQRRRAIRRREQSAHEWVRRTFQDQRKNPGMYQQTNTGQASTTQSSSNGWSQWNPFKKKNRSSSPPRYVTM